MLEGGRSLLDTLVAHDADCFGGFRIFTNQKNVGRSTASTRLAPEADQAEREALLEAGWRMQAELARLGLTEEEFIADFKRWRKARRAK